jgi:Protein of unknown function (DUF3800)
MSYRDRETLFIFFDESGNFDFNPSGSRYWSLTALCTFHPLEGRETFHDLAYSLADDGRGQEYFHATEDRQNVRDSVFDLILRLPNQCDIHCSLAEKKKVPTSLRKTETEFYTYMCKRALRYLVSLEKHAEAKKIVVILSSIFTKSEQNKLIGDLKATFKEKVDVPFWIYFKGSQGDVNCQIVDYCSWAISIKWARNESRSYDFIRQRIVSETQLFDSDGPDYY